MRQICILGWALLVAAPAAADVSAEVLAMRTGLARPTIGFVNGCMPEYAYPMKRQDYVTNNNVSLLDGDGHRVTERGQVTMAQIRQLPNNGQDYTLHTPKWILGDRHAINQVPFYGFMLEARFNFYHDTDEQKPFRQNVRLYGSYFVFFYGGNPGYFPQPLFYWPCWFQPLASCFNWGFTQGWMGNHPADIEGVIFWWWEDPQQAGQLLPEPAFIHLFRHGHIQGTNQRVELVPVIPHGDTADFTAIRPHFCAARGSHATEVCNQGDCTCCGMSVFVRLCCLGNDRAKYGTIWDPPHVEILADDDVFLTKLAWGNTHVGGISLDEIEAAMPFNAADRKGWELRDCPCALSDAEADHYIIQQKIRRIGVVPNSLTIINPPAQDAD